MNRFLMPCAAIALAASIAGAAAQPTDRREIPAPEDWTGDPEAAQPGTGEVMRRYHNVLSTIENSMPENYTGDADLDYAQRALLLHRGAMQMAQEALVLADDPALRAIAQQTLEQEEARIRALENWLDQEGVAAAR